MSAEPNPNASYDQADEVFVDLSGRWPPFFDGRLQVMAMIQLGGVEAVTHDDADAHFFGVYAGQKDGPVMCIAEFPARASAQTFMDYAASRFEQRDECRPAAPRG